MFKLILAQLKKQWQVAFFYTLTSPLISNIFNRTKHKGENTMRKILTLALSLMMIFVLGACSSNEKGAENEEGTTTTSAQTFNIGAIPDQDASELNPNMDQMAKYLSEKIGHNVKFIPSNDYASLVTAFERGEMQMVWFGGLTGVQARSAVEGAEAIAQRPSDAEFKSVFIQQKGLGLEGIEDVKGHTFTFGSESSTSGSLMPRYFMTQAGIDPEKDLNGQPNYSGNHDTTIKLVETGAFETGALNISVWEKTVAEGNVDLDKVEVFYTTPDYYDYNWTVNKDKFLDTIYGEGTKEKLKEALFAMSPEGSEEEKAVLNFFQTDKFIETNNDNYKNIEEVARSLGMVN